ncbi:hypothetical protein Poly21_44630 [Allorhodopirellula heiligendammensis]|uniref:Uncharacterized protein n=1 Tax=Allorhodopirellula heiligendammensis TaxID=2714739 RepID=A0A5C6BES8_9BACT|nr:hypothetical protein Poly21_44630 [Allorhodopirellula heiligendammensis]
MLRILKNPEKLIPNSDGCCDYLLRLDGSRLSAKALHRCVCIPSTVIP